MANANLVTDADLATMAKLWSDAIGCPLPGADDDFFDLGGQSIIAARLVRAVRQTFGVQVQLSAVFDHPTLNDFTSVVAHNRAAAQQAAQQAEA
jgi:aryl carrier-like protein